VCEWGVHVLGVHARVSCELILQLYLDERLQETEIESDQMS